MNIVVIDDDAAARYIAEKMLSKIPEVGAVKAFSNSRDAEGYLLNNPVDVILVDIVIQEENGIQVARYFRSLYPEIIIIFMTSHREYALEAFDLYALDYMVKLISAERLNTTIEKAKGYIRSSIQEQKTLSVYTLGGCNVKDSSGKPVKFYSSKSEELLFYLLYHHGKIIGKWKIIDDLFPDLTPANGEGYLKTTVYKLRRALNLNDVKDTVIQSNGGYFIDSSQIYIDYIDMKNRISRIDRWEPDFLEDGIGAEQLFQGELYGDKDYRWAYDERNCLTNLYKGFAKGLCNYILAENITEKYSSVLYILKKLQSLNELDQETAYLFLRLYASLKDRKAFDGYYGKYCGLLEEELGVMPDRDFMDHCKSLRKSL
ncbi:MAG TPA: response regulator [Clostridiales bacterium]|nr:response regulator [Clostridiales bacterium]